jgi:hypothetical protein
MNVFRIVVVVALALAVLATCSHAQGGGSFDPTAYAAFLKKNADLSAAGLAGLYPAGAFAEKAQCAPAQAAFFARVDSFYHLTPTELSLLTKHGFMVSERLTGPSFGTAYKDIYHADLPVYVSADAILHAYHRSYDAMLQDAEKNVLKPVLDSLLGQLANDVATLLTQYIGVPEMQAPIADMDLYVTMARRLLGRDVPPQVASNAARVTAIESGITGLQPQSVVVFGSTPRGVDFSQFTLRGHYTDDADLQRYFRAMIWLGRTEMYAEPPSGAIPKPTDADCREQTIAAVLIAKACEAPGRKERLQRIEGIIRAFVGDQDNITAVHLQQYIVESGIASAADLCDTTRWHTFQAGLLQKSYAVQRINSQILWSDPMAPESIRPAASFLLFGQRFVVDSYVTANVVYDKIVHGGTKITRMLPSALDILFALGNDAAGKILGPELEQYHYASNLAGLRYLIDSYEPAYWDSSLYAGWLNAIRTLAPPSERQGLPAFMQTAAWWQKGMNTQLAAWAQLRHDNLLYAKQSYSGGVICSFPESYVEPVPAFFRAMHALALNGARVASTDLLQGRLPRVSAYFTGMAATMDTLEGIATKQLAGVARTDAERSFLHRMVYSVTSGCAPTTDGWYARLYYCGEESFQESEYVVADVHTAPTDAMGNMVGWVKHGGTGRINVGVLIAPCSDGSPMAYVGPMASYLEHTTLNFKRLTDLEWETQYINGTATRPAWVNLYLADGKGGSRGTGPTLLTGVDNPREEEQRPGAYVLAQNYPNPFNPSTLITFAVPPGAGNQTVTITVFDVRGVRVRQLLHMSLAPGSYSVRWDGTSDNGTQVSSGAFFYELRAGDFTATRSMMLLR